MSGCEEPRREGPGRKEPGREEPREPRGAARRPDDDTPDRQTLAAVQGLLADLASPGTVIEADSDLACDLGLTSFDMMVVHVRLEELRGGPLGFDALVGARTVADLARAVAGR